MKRAVLVCGGSMQSPVFMSKYISPEDYIVAVDSGAGYLKSMNIVPDIYIGDLDSIDTETLEDLKSKKVKIDVYPSHKNSTDSQIAVEKMIEKGYNNIIMLAATGNRADHMTGNIFLLELMLQQNVSGMICDEHNQILLMDDKNNHIEITCDGYFSVVPLSSIVEGITYKNAKYPLYEKTILRGDTLGISNEAFHKDEMVEISISRGTLLVFISKDNVNTSLA